MRRLFAIIVAAIAFVGCSMDDITVSYQTDKSDIYYASFENFGEESRTYIDENVKLLWHEDDRISLFRTTLNEQFKFTGATGDNSGSFSAIPSDEWVTGSDVSTNYAVYPYDATTKLSNDEIIQLTMPAVQNYAENSFGRGANTMVAASESTSSKFLPFRNLGGYIIVKLYGEDTTIKSIEFKGNNGEVIAGAATAEAKYGYLPVITMLENGTTTITLNCGEEGVTISSDSANPTSFWFVVPPITFEGGFTFTITDINGNTFTKSTTKSQTVVRNVVKSMSGFEPTFEGEGEDPEVATKPASNEIWYKSIDGNKTAPYRYPSDSNSLVSNTYSEDLGYWILEYTYDISKIDVETFMSCTKFTEIVLPDSITTINEDAFSGTSNLKKIHLPANLKLIQYQAFYSSAVSEIHIEDLDAWCGISMMDKSFGGSYSLYIDNKPLTNVEIPENITSLSYRAFWHCKSVEHLKLHDNFTKIDSYAFNSNTNLQTVDLGDSIEEIGRFSFAFCDKLTTITIPESVTKIGDSAFKGCSSLSGIYCESTTPPGIYDWSDNDELWIAFDDIADNALIYVPAESVDKYKTASGWSRYEDIIVGYNFETGEIVPDTTATPANNEIWYTNGSTTEATTPYKTDVFGANIVSNTYDATKERWVIKFDGDVTTVGDDAFYNCSSLTTITIPDSVTTIGSSAFSKCSGLTSITIPDSVSTIDSYAFSNCDSLLSITIPNKVTYLSERVFESCDALTDVTIPKSVKTIGSSAFYNCASLANIVIPNSVTKIMSSAFMSCKKLEDITIGDSVESIGDGAFYGCTSLQSITLPNSLTTLGSNVFYDCPTLSNINIPSSVISINEHAFSGSTSLNKVDIQDLSSWCKISFQTTTANPLCSGAELYLNGTKVTDLVISSDITLVSFAAFYGCSSIKSVTIGPNTTFGTRVFEDCDNLLDVTFLDGVTTIRNGMFWNCNLLANVSIPNSVATIENYAFRECISLKNITLPSSVTNIGKYAFTECPLQEVYCQSIVPPTLGNEYVFDYNSSGRIFYVPSNSVESYKSASYWNEYAHCIIGYNFETGEIVIPSVYPANNEIWYTNGSTTTATTPYKTDFGGATIQSNTYNSNDECWVIKFDKDITAIGYEAFKFCSNLESVYIPTSVELIDGDAFYNCSSLKEVYCMPTTPPDCRYGAFPFDSTIYVPSASVSAYKSAPEYWTDYTDKIVGYDF